MKSIERHHCGLLSGYCISTVESHDQNMFKIKTDFHKPHRCTDEKQMLKSLKTPHNSAWGRAMIYLMYVFGKKKVTLKWYQGVYAIAYSIISWFSTTCSKNMENTHTHITTYSTRVTVWSVAWKVYSAIHKVNDIILDGYIWDNQHPFYLPFGINISSFSTWNGSAASNASAPRNEI